MNSHVHLRVARKEKRVSHSHKQSKGFYNFFAAIKTKYFNLNDSFLWKGENISVSVVISSFTSSLRLKVENFYVRYRCTYRREENMSENSVLRKSYARRWSWYEIKRRFNEVISSDGTPKRQTPAKRASPSGRAIHNHLQLHENCKIRRKLLRALARASSRASWYLRAYDLCTTLWTRIEGGWTEASKASMIDTIFWKRDMLL